MPSILITPSIKSSVSSLNRPEGIAMIQHVGNSDRCAYRASLKKEVSCLQLFFFANENLCLISCGISAHLEGNVGTLLNNLGHHIQNVITEKYEKVKTLSKVKDNSVEEGRAYVLAYVDYTHTLEAIEAVMSHGGHQ